MFGECVFFNTLQWERRVFTLRYKWQQCDEELNTGRFSGRQELKTVQLLEKRYAAPRHCQFLPSRPTLTKQPRSRGELITEPPLVHPPSICASAFPLLL